ncbi:MAG: hypothetical protein AB7N54_07460 [Alphaproteobacteria bacterium]
MRIAFCASLYEAGRPCLPAFCAALSRAAAGHDARLIAAVDGLAEPARALWPIVRHMPVELHPVPAGATVAQVRCVLLAAAAASDCDVLVFADMDDEIAPDAVGEHLEALAGADFSYGDMDLMDAGGALLDRRLFTGAAVPWRVETSEAIGARNFLGLSNTAVRRASLPGAIFAMPADIGAADWWLFTTLLGCRRKGARTGGAVGRYRLHASSLLGAGAPATPAAARFQLGLMARHYRAFRAAPAMAARLAATQDAIEALAATPASAVAAALASMAGTPGVWFEHAGRLADRLVAPAPPARLAV